MASTSRSRHLCSKSWTSHLDRQIGLKPDAIARLEFIHRIRATRYEKWQSETAHLAVTGDKIRGLDKSPLPACEAYGFAAGMILRLTVSFADSSIRTGRPWVSYRDNTSLS